MPTLNDWIAALEQRGVRVNNMIGELPKHGSREFATRNPDEIQGLVVHHGANSDTTIQGIKGIARYHVGPNHITSKGCPGICYTAAITWEGVFHVCHDLDVATWSQGWRSRPGDENADFLGLLVLGNFRSPGNPDGKEPTRQQIATVLAAYDAARAIWPSWAKGTRLWGHFDFGKAVCPGSTLEAVIRAVRTHEAQPGAVVDLGTTRGRQDALKRLGYYAGALDGIWGPRSRAALVEFQRGNELVPDGVWGPRTDAAIRRALAGEPG